MILQDIIKLMNNSDYQSVGINVPGVYLYQKRVQEKMLYVSVMDTKEADNLTVSNVRSIILQIQSKLIARDHEPELLSIIITDQISQYRNLSDLNTMLWFIDSTSQKLMIYENQENYLDSLRIQIEEILDRYRINQQYGQQIENVSDHQTSKSRWSKNRIPVCTITIIVVNILIFVCMDWFCNSMQYEQIVERFGITWNSVKVHGEYYRILTYMFLHSGMDHLLNNMLVLFFLGQILERILSKPKFLFIYFGSGIIAGVGSMVYNMINGKYVLSIGASGAIFGLVGAILFAVLINKGRLADISTRQIVFFILFSLYAGYTAGNVDNAAHIGGFLTGMFLAAIVIKREKLKERENT